MQSLSRKNGRKMQSSAIGEVAGNTIPSQGNIRNAIIWLRKMAEKCNHIRSRKNGRKNGRKNDTWSRGKCRE
jgi:hypothetical protein